MNCAEGQAVMHSKVVLKKREKEIRVRLRQICADYDQLLHDANCLAIREDIEIKDIIAPIELQEGYFWGGGVDE